VGLVYDPVWLAGLQFTADYFHIAIDREIAPISGSNPVVQSLCLASPGGSSPYCALIQRPISYNSTSPLNFPTLYYSQVQNFQRQWTEGVDFQLNYQTDLAGWHGLDGLLNLRLLWTHTAFLKTLGLPGSVITDVAGSANAPGAALPSEKAALMANYSDGTWSLDVMERYYGSIRQNPNPTLIYAPNTGDLPFWFQTDVNITYAIDSRFAAFLNVSNLFDAQPDIFQVPGYTGSPGMNYPVVPYEDVIGRYVTVGVKFRTD
jgi:iron complex outermembrane receptor protein